MKKNSLQACIFATVLSLWALFGTTGCGLLLGNVKPVEYHSNRYRILDLSLTSADWRRIESGIEENSDLTYQSIKNASIISLNSSCRPNQPQKTLKEFTRQLLLGITENHPSIEREIQINDKPSLETTIEGIMNEESVKIQTIVMRNDNCIFDLMFISRPAFFEQGYADFSRFASSLTVKTGKETK